MTRMSPMAVVFGGTGFIGRQIVRTLARTGARVRVATRVPEHAFFLQPCGAPGQIAAMACTGSADSIARVLEGADLAVNCIGQLFETRRASFDRAHIEIPRSVAQSCLASGVSRLVHLSALGVDRSEARYARTKREGEQAVQAAFPPTTILRPSVVFGPDDHFFNQFASMARISPVLPLIGGGKTRFQPVFVNDVAQAACTALTAPPVPLHDPRGKIFELGGPEIFTFREILDRIALWTGRRRPLISVPWGLARIQATVLECLPTPPLTRDQVELLQTDSVLSLTLPGLADLGIQATGIEAVVPDYLARYREGGPFASKEAA